MVYNLNLSNFTLLLLNTLANVVDPAVLQAGMKAYDKASSAAAKKEAFRFLDISKVVGQRHADLLLCRTMDITLPKARFAA